LKLELFLASRYSFTKQKEAFLAIINLFSIIGIALGVATLIIVMSVMKGYEKSLFTKILGFKGHLMITTIDKTLYNWEEMGADLAKIIPKAGIIIPTIEKEALIMSKGAITGILLKALNYEDLDRKISATEGSLISANNCSGIFLGEDLEKNLAVNPYDKIKIVVPEINQTLVGVVPRMKSYQTCGTFDLGFADYNNSLIFLPSLKEAQKLFRLGEGITALEINLPSFEEAPLIKKSLIAALRSNNYGNEKLVVLDWQEINKTITEGLQLERTVMFFILSLIVIIAVFNIISSLILLVKDKSKEIAILRTVGLESRAIMRVFIICGLILGFIGTALGIILGVVISLNLEKIRLFLEQFTGVKIFDPLIYFLTKLPCDLDFREVFWIASLSLIASFVATLYPAWRVAKLPPAAILRQG
jgi:lipoprotein-releasing system permease protein